MGNPAPNGWIRTPEGFLFEISGSNISLDFTNTISSRRTQRPNELLRSYKEILSWARHTKILSRMEELNLLKQASRNPAKAETIRKSAIAFRECLFEIVTCIIEKQEIPGDLLRRWNRLVHQTMDKYEFVRTKQGISWQSAADPLDLDSFLWPIVFSAVELLTGPNLIRIRRCAAENCDWLFLDSSKRGNRRWCEMSVCGNRAKAQRFYSKRKAFIHKNKRKDKTRSTS